MSLAAACVLRGADNPHLQARVVAHGVHVDHQRLLAAGRARGGRGACQSVAIKARGQRQGQPRKEPAVYVASAETRQQQEQRGAAGARSSPALQRQRGAPTFACAAAAPPRSSAASERPCGCAPSQTASACRRGGCLGGGEEGREGVIRDAWLVTQRLQAALPSAVHAHAGREARSTAARRCQPCGGFRSLAPACVASQRCVALSTPPPSPPSLFQASPARTEGSERTFWRPTVLPWAASTSSSSLTNMMPRMARRSPGRCTGMRLWPGQEGGRGEASRLVGALPCPGERERWRRAGVGHHAPL